MAVKSLLFLVWRGFLLVLYNYKGNTEMFCSIAKPIDQSILNLNKILKKKKKVLHCNPGTQFIKKNHV